MKVMPRPKHNYEVDLFPNNSCAARELINDTEQRFVNAGVVNAAILGWCVRSLERGTCGR
jgi:hypothetical protein